MTDSHPPELAAGQTWTFAGAPNDRARVFIGALEMYGDLEVAHVALIDLPPPPNFKTDRDAVTVSHMPFDRAAVEASVDAYVGENEAPAEFESGRAEWREAVEAGEAGVFTITLAQALEAFYAAVGDGAESDT